MDDISAIFDSFVGESSVTATVEKPNLDPSALFRENEEVERALKEEKDHILSVDKIESRAKSNSDSRSRYSSKAEEPVVESRYSSSESRYSGYGSRYSSYNSRPVETVTYDEDYIESKKEELAQKRYNKKNVKFAKQIYGKAASVRKAGVPSPGIDEDIFTMQKNAQEKRRYIESEMSSPYEIKSTKSTLKVYGLSLLMMVSEAAAKVMFTSQKSNVKNITKKGTTK